MHVKLQQQVRSSQERRLVENQPLKELSHGVFAEDQNQEA